MHGKSYVFASATIAALGGLLFGFDTAVISGTTEALKSLYALSDQELGFTVASALIGTINGSIAVGRPADVWGRRRTMFALAILYFVSAVGCAVAWDWYSLLFFRFIGGLGVGGASVVSPMYIAEISPARLRGRLVALAQFNIVLGILLAFLSNYVVSLFDFGADEWRWMFGVEAIPALAYYLLLFRAPMSPRWLLARGRDAEARAVIEKLGAGLEESVDQFITRVRDSIVVERHSLHEPFFQRRYARPIMLAVAIATFNQLSGINAVMYYAPAIFKSAGAGEQSALLQSVGLGAVNLVFTMLAMSVIDRFGRRRLMVVGSIGYIVSLSATAWAFYTQGQAGAAGQAFTRTGGLMVMVGLIVFIASHAFGQGAVIWVYLSEVFPTQLRARGQALGSFTHWVMAAGISWTFPVIAERSGGHVFAFYAVCMVGQLVWVLAAMPETRGVALEDIQRRMEAGGAGNAR